MNEDVIQSDSGGVTLKVRVAPRSAKNGVAGLVEGSLKITLTAPPVDGAANEALIETLAKLCGLRKSNITILSGHTARQKRVRLTGADLGKVKEALGLI
jgi:uncharacterized protein (TIGR00251 family)